MLPRSSHELVPSRTLPAVTREHPRFKAGVRFWFGLEIDSHEAQYLRPTLQRRRADPQRTPIPLTPVKALLRWYLQTQVSVPSSTKGCDIETYSTLLIPDS